jgi:hypothetical protein
MDVRFEDFERAGLTEDQILAVKEFVKQDNAQQAIESLEQLKKAA